MIKPETKDGGSDEMLLFFHGKYRCIMVYHIIITKLHFFCMDKHDNVINVIINLPFRGRFIQPIDGHFGDG